jgi:hypothetical protein
VWTKGGNVLRRFGLRNVGHVQIVSSECGRSVNECGREAGGSGPRRSLRTGDEHGGNRE